MTQRAFVSVWILASLWAGAQPATAPADAVALQDVTVITGDGTAPQPGMTILIRAERIESVFRTGSRALPAGTQVVPLSGHFVVPGLSDSHYHFTLGKRSKEAEAGLRQFAFLGGVTVVRDMAGDAIALAELAKMAASSDVQSPRVYFSALMAGPTHILNDRRADDISHGLPRGEAPWARAITAEIDITEAITQAKATGATGVKLYSDLTPETVSRLTAEVHRQGLKVWSHAAVYPGKPSDAVRAGVDVISHSNLVVPEGMTQVPERYADSYPMLDYGSVPVESKPISDLLQLMLEKGTFLDPTLLVTSRLERTKPGEIFKDPAKMAEWTYDFTMRAHIRRIPIVVGTDVQENPTTSDFPNIHKEMELLVTKAGLTPLEAITAATRNGAQALGIAEDFGTIAPGKIADLVVLGADPTADIRNTTAVVYVVKGGKFHERHK